MSSGANEAKKVLSVLPPLVLLTVILVAIQAILVTGFGVWATFKALSYTGDNASTFLAFHVSQLVFGLLLLGACWGIVRRVRAVWTPLLISELIAVLIGLPDLLDTETLWPAAPIVIHALVVGFLLVATPVRSWVRAEDELPA